MNTKRPTVLFFILAVLLGVALLSGCGANNAGGSGQPTPDSDSSGGGAASSPSPSGTDASAPPATDTPAESPPKELVKVTQVTNWFAQPEHGGNYAALEEGYYKDAGLDMTIQSGGPGVSATQLVASGKAQFGMGSSDEILIARSEGLPLVAIFGTFQKSPQALLYHADQPIAGMEDLNGRKVYIASGSSYWEYFKKAFDLSKATELKYTGDLSLFLNDPKSVTQSYITSEPYVAKQKGVDTKYLLNADYGFDPYANIMYTTESFLKEHPDEVKAFVEATRKGWDYFQDNWKEIIPALAKANPDNPVDVMEFGATALQPLVYEGDAATYGVGYMSTERWEAMNKKLVDLGLLKEPQDVSKAFTTEFLPKK